MTRLSVRGALLDRPVLLELDEPSANEIDRALHAPELMQPGCVCTLEGSPAGIIRAISLGTVDAESGEPCFRLTIRETETIAESWPLARVRSVFQAVLVDDETNDRT